jgi:hypothetical protein
MQDWERVPTPERFKFPRLQRSAPLNNDIKLQASGQPGKPIGIINNDERGETLAPPVPGLQDDVPANSGWLAHGNDGGKPASASGLIA